MAQAKKSYGQHFLKNDSIAARIAGSLKQAAVTGLVLEVGPGQGMLTRQILQLAGVEVHAVEADQDMITHLEAHLPEIAPRLVSRDFLKFNVMEYFGGRQFCLIGNFPYNISTQIVFRMLENREVIPEMVGMFQKEVADRIVADAGSRVYGITSVLVQTYYRAEYLFTVERGSFHPPPKVLSAVIRLTRKEGFDPGCDESVLRSIVKMAFNQRRKMLRNTLKPFFPPEKLMTDPFFEQRPEQLTWEQFVELAKLAREPKG